MTHFKNLFLIGYRCTGKSAAGRRMAEKLNWKFVDADKELVSVEGCSIAQIVSESGWAYFRRIETSILERLSRGENQVIATGGGVVLDRENIRRMRASGFVVWLRARPETIYKRMREDENTVQLRPALTNKRIQDELLETLSERIPLYQSAMGGAVDTDDKSIEAVCDEVFQMIKG